MSEAIVQDSAAVAALLATEDGAATLALLEEAIESPEKFPTNNTPARIKLLQHNSDEVKDRKPGVAAGRFYNTRYETCTDEIKPVVIVGMEHSWIERKTYDPKATKTPPVATYADNDPYIQNMLKTTKPHKLVSAAGNKITQTTTLFLLQLTDDLQGAVGGALFNVQSYGLQRLERLSQNLRSVEAEARKRLGLPATARTVPTLFFPLNIKSIVNPAANGQKNSIPVFAPLGESLLDNLLPLTSPVVKGALEMKKLIKEGVIKAQYDDEDAPADPSADDGPAATDSDPF